MTQKKPVRLVPTLLPQSPVVPSPVHGSEHLPPGERLVYGNIADSLVFIPETRASELVAVYDALDASKSWGALRAALREVSPDDAYQSILAYGEDVPDDELFDVKHFGPGPYGDRDFPAWPAQEMLAWVPEAIREKFGNVVLTTFSGECLNFDPEPQEQIVAAFRSAGFVVTREDALVARASGWD